MSPTTCSSACCSRLHDARRPGVHPQQRRSLTRLVYDDVVNRLAELARNVAVGHASDAAVAIGPLIGAEHRNRVEGFVSVQKLMAQRWSPRTVVEDLATGYYFEPTILANATTVLCHRASRRCSVRS